MKSDKFKHYINLFCEEFITRFEGSGFVQGSNEGEKIKLYTLISEAWSPLDTDCKYRINKIASSIISNCQISNIFNLSPLFVSRKKYRNYSVYIDLDLNSSKERFLEEFSYSKDHFPFLPLFSDLYANSYGVCFHTKNNKMISCIKGSETTPEFYNIPRELVHDAMCNESKEICEDKILITNMEWQNFSQKYYNDRASIFMRCDCSIYDIFLDSIP